VLLLLWERLLVLEVGDIVIVVGLMSSPVPVRVDTVLESTLLVLLDGLGRLFLKNLVSPLPLLLNVHYLVSFYLSLPRVEPRVTGVDNVDLASPRDPRGFKCCGGLAAAALLLLTNAVS